MSFVHRRQTNTEKSFSMATLIITQYASRSILLSFLIWGNRKKKIWAQKVISDKRETAMKLSIFDEILFIGNNKILLFELRKTSEIAHCLHFHTPLSQNWPKSFFSGILRISNSANLCWFTIFFSNLKWFRDIHLHFGYGHNFKLVVCFTRDSINYFKWHILVYLIMIQWDIKVYSDRRK